MGVAVGAIVDVFTLGGTVDESTGVATVQQLAQSSGGGRSTSVHSTAAIDNDRAEAALADGPNLHAGQPMPQLATYANSGATAAWADSAGGQAAAGTAATDDRTKRWRGANHCVRHDSTSNSLADFFENGCGFRVWVEFVGPKGQGAAGPIRPGGKEAVSKARGSVHWAACEYPGVPHAGSSASSPKWSGSGPYSCVSS